jgi:hypothetical protein
VVDLRFGAVNALLIKMRPKRKTYRLKIRDGLKMIFKKTNLILKLI